MLEKFEQTPERIKECVSILEGVRAKCSDPDPSVRLRRYAEFLHRNIKYDHEAVDKFYKAKEEGNNDFRYEDFFNVCKLFLQRAGACQQFAVAMSMLCYGDPEIECQQAMVKIRPDDTDSYSLKRGYKHSVSHVSIPSQGVKGVMDVTNMASMGSKVYGMQEYLDTQAERGNRCNYLGMAYYVKDLPMEKMFTKMQGFGEGIKFDFEGYASGSKSFEESFDPKRLATVKGYQEALRTPQKGNEDTTGQGL